MQSLIGYTFDIVSLQAEYEEIAGEQARVPHGGVRACTPWSGGVGAAAASM